VAVAAHPVLHAAAVVPAHTILHAPAAGVPVPAAADTVPHPAVAPATGVPFPATTVAMDAAIASAIAVIPVSSFASDLYDTISPAAAAAASIPVPVSAASTPASVAALATIAVAVSTAPSAAAATTSTTVISLAFPAITLLPSRFFRAASSTCEVFSERSKHLVSFR
jgi:hypothetical protein